MNSRLYFMAAFVFKITASQNFTHSELLGTEMSLTLTCETDDLSKAILFKLGTDNKGGCIAVGSCDTVTTGYEKPTQQGTTITKMKITLCNETRDIGSWTCTYGGSTSVPVMITTCSEDPSTTQLDVTTERQLTTTNDATTTIQSTDIICTPICISIAALLSLIALVIIVYLIVLLVLCCTGRITCNLPLAFNEKNTSKTSIQNYNDKHENRQSYKTRSENEYRIYKGDGRTTSLELTIN